MISSIKDIFEQGYESYAEGEFETDNPYEKDSENYRSWNEGYYTAKEDRKEYLDSINPLGSQL